MQVPAFIGNTQVRLQQAWANVKEVPRISKEWIVHKFNQIREIWEQDLWPKFLKPIIDRNITPLNKTDAILLTSSAIVAASIAILVPLIFGKALIAMTAVAGLTIFLGAWTFSQHRVQKHFDSIAWDNIDRIRRAANCTTCRVQYFAEMSRELIELQKPEFKHLEGDLKELNEHMQAFRKVAIKPYYEDRKNAVTHFLAHLKALTIGAQGDTNLIAALEQEIAKIGKPEQNIGEIENKRLALNGIQTPAAKQGLTALNEQVDELIKVAENPSFKDAKGSFLYQLNKLQTKLDWYKPIENLPEHTPTDAPIL